jgi:RNA polymerase sigma-70 factor (ECF subfamily)
MHPSADEDADRGDMSRLCAGQDSAFNGIMVRWKDRLIGFLHRLCGDHGTASLLAQETFVRVYRHRKSYNPRLPFSTWIFSIARNLARNHQRWRSRHPETLLPPEELPESGDGGANPDPVGQAESRERLRALHTAISNLSRDQREVLILSVYEGLSHEEIAEIIDSSPRAVEGRLYRARQELREALADHL